MLFRSGAIMLILVLATARADSIRIGGETHEGVYIKKSKQYYYVHFPKEGRVEKVSQKRRDVTNVNISNEATREELFKEYKLSRESLEESLNSKVVENPVDSQHFLAQKELLERAEFETQFAHWEALPAEAREIVTLRITERLLESIDRRLEEAARVGGQLESLKSKRQIHESNLRMVRSKRDVAIEKAEREDSSDVFMEGYEESILKSQISGDRFYGDHWRVAAEAESIIAARKKKTAQKVYGEEANRIEQDIGSVDANITRKQRDARGVQSKLASELYRIEGQLLRTGALNDALISEYRVSLKAEEILELESDRSTASRKFSIDRTPWRIVCYRRDGGLDDGFNITLCDADTDKPLTRIGGVDYLFMRSRIFDEPGSYYLQIEQGQKPAGYRLVVESLEAL